MAIVQVSRITHRKGLSENLPQLAGAEFGWVIDERKLYIGNGTLAEGAPAVGNTEVLTQYSDILGLADGYTYKGEAAGYTVQTGPSASAPVSRTLQRKIDDFASVKDFGATGDGTTDDTAAINRALFQLFCRQTNSEIRRSLFFPAGTYLITEPIKVPPFARLYGEGSSSSIIKLSSTASGSYVMQTADSLQQIGSNIGDSSATPPTDIEIASLCFETAKSTTAVLVEDATHMLFESVDFKGPLAQSDLGTAGADLALVRFDSTATLVTSSIVFERCKFSNATYAFDADEQIEGISVNNSRFTTLYQGVLIGTGTPVSGGPQGFCVTQSLFDKIRNEGISIGAVSNNMSGYNIFLDVGNNFSGAGSAITPVININGDDNVSVGDMFERSDADDASYARIALNNKDAFGLDKGQRYKFGSYAREVGKTVSLTTQVSATAIFTMTSTRSPVFSVRYSFYDPVSYALRMGVLNVVGQDTDDSSGTLVYTDEYSENATTGLVLSVEQSSTTITVKYTATDAGTFKYTVEYLG